MMTAILSCTADDLYSFNLPFAVYSWHKIGVDSIVFFPVQNYHFSGSAYIRFIKATEMCSNIAPSVKFIPFVCQPDKVATYAQCARLYAAGIKDLNTDILITADADMCVFNREYWENFDYNGAVNIIGADLVPPGQFPMCYIAAPLVGWRNFMDIGRRSPQQCLDDLLGHLEAEHFRGNYWAKDQETIFNALEGHPYPFVKHLRAREGTQFASRRADRDGWQVTPDIIDAHLPRPGYDLLNFTKIVELFHIMYPHDDLTWMHEYYNEYTNLLEPNCAKGES